MLIYDYFAVDCFCCCLVCVPPSVLVHFLPFFSFRLCAICPFFCRVRLTTRRGRLQPHSGRLPVRARCRCHSATVVTFGDVRGRKRKLLRKPHQIHVYGVVLSFGIMSHHNSLLFTCRCVCFCMCCWCDASFPVCRLGRFCDLRCGDERFKCTVKHTILIRNTHTLKKTQKDKNHS